MATLKLSIDQQLHVQRRFSMGMLVKMTKHGDPDFVVGTTWGAHVSVCITGIKPVDPSTPLNVGKPYSYLDQPVFDFEGNRYTTVDNHSPKERKVTTIYSVYVDGEWVKLVDWCSDIIE